MADVNKSISINFEGKTDDLQSELRKIPTVTKQAATKMAGQLNTALDKTAKRAEKVTRQMSQSFKNVGASLSRVGIASAAAGAAVLVFVQKMADLSNQLTDASARSGLAIETLGGLRLAAEGSGLAFENLERGLDRFPAAIKAAQDGSKSVMSAFDDLGVTLEDLEGKDTDQLFRQVASALGQIEDPAKRSSAAMRIFGAATGGALLQSGALENMQAFADLASEFGVDMETAADSAGTFQRAMAELKTTSAGTADEILQVVLGTENITDSIFAASDAVVFIGTIFEDVFGTAKSLINALLAPTRLLTEQAEAAIFYINAILTGDFTGAIEATKMYGQSFTNLGQSIVDAYENVQTLDNTIDEAAKRVDVLRDKRKAILEQNKREREDNQKTDKANEKAAKAAEDAAEAEKKRAEQQAKNAALAKQIAETEAAAKSELAAITKQATDAGLTAHQLEIQAIDERIAKVSELAMVTGDHEQAYETMRKLQAQRDKAIHDNKMEMLQQEKDTALDMASIVASSVGTTAQSIQTLLENTGNITKRQAVQLFMLQKAANVAQIAMNTSVAITKALADLGPIGGPVAAGFMAAAGAAQTAAVLSQPPPAFDVGGMVGRTSGSDVVQASLLTGEAVLDRATVRRMGGEDGINAMQRGDMPQQQVVVVQPFKHFDKFIQASSRRGRYNTGRRRPLGVGSY